MAKWFWPESSKLLACGSGLPTYWQKCVFAAVVVLAGSWVAHRWLQITLYMRNCSKRCGTNFTSWQSLWQKASILDAILVDWPVPWSAWDFTSFWLSSIMPDTACQACTLPCAWDQHTSSVQILMQWSCEFLKWLKLNFEFISLTQICSYLSVCQNGAKKKSSHDSLHVVNMSTDSLDSCMKKMGHCRYWWQACT